ncbi:hypothetical protein HK096_003578 [Nowakowskiella sp. JEL0078]|nr:hypothetical protein HK096_003578 [Nowakowskiella sp. JEL0078]
MASKCSATEPVYCPNAPSIFQCSTNGSICCDNDKSFGTCLPGFYCLDTGCSLYPASSTIKTSSGSTTSTTTISLASSLGSSSRTSSVTSSVTSSIFTTTKNSQVNLSPTSLSKAEEGNGSTLTTVAIVAIVIAVVIFLICIIAGYILLKKFKKLKESKAQPFRQEPQLQNYQYQLPVKPNEQYQSPNVQIVPGFISTSNVSSANTLNSSNATYNQYIANSHAGSNSFSMPSISSATSDTNQSNYNEYIPGSAFHAQKPFPAVTHKY